MDYKNNLDLWLNSSIDEKYKKQIRNMSDSEKEDSFYKFLEFGTAGIRGPRGLGTNRLNIFNIRMYSLAYARYMIENTNVLENGVAIAYDNRHMSKEFSIESAKVFGKLGIKTYLFTEPRPTPQLSWIIREMNLSGGLVLTASHNPPQDNGYKIYDDEGCQIAQEKFEIFEKHLKNLGYNFEIPILSEEELKSQGLLENIGIEWDKKYTDAVASIGINPVQNQKIDFVYSSQHGAACVVTENMFKDLGIKINVVEDHRKVDPDFTNAPFPNPEDPRAYDLLIRDAKETGSKLIISTDPDGDRFGFGYLHNGEYKLFTGNETAAIILEYILSNKKSSNTLGHNPYAIFTNVTGMLGKDICEAYGVKMHETLTGFKWIGSVYNNELQKGNHNFIIGYEESFGFLLSDVGRDKDSLQAALFIHEIAEFYEKKGLSLVDQLENIYKKYGYRIEYTKSIILEGSEGFQKIQSAVDYFSEVNFEQVAKDGIIEMIDYSKQEVYTKNNKSNIDIPKHKCIKLFFDKKNWLAIRPSGTEPKLKFYLSLTAPNKKELEKINVQVLNYIKNHLNKFDI